MLLFNNKHRFLSLYFNILYFSLGIKPRVKQFMFNTSCFFQAGKSAQPNISGYIYLYIYIYIYIYICVCVFRSC